MNMDPKENPTKTKEDCKDNSIGDDMQLSSPVKGSSEMEPTVVGTFRNSCTTPTFGSPCPSNSAISSLISNPIISLALSPSNSFPTLTPGTSLAKNLQTGLILGGAGTPTTSTKRFKRPMEGSATKLPLSKRARESFCFGTGENNITKNIAKDKENSTPGKSQPKFYKAYSESQIEDIKKALDDSHSNPNLIGNFTIPHLLPCLPTTDSTHYDLREISPGTLAALLEGMYDSTVSSYLIVDCRYPYEYNGGHIKGAVNLFTEKQVWEEFFNGKGVREKPEKPQPNQKRDIIIFHCEFSKERGPRMCRSLRSWDRSLHAAHFPTLHYPELYVLHRGYKNFFATHPELCVPISYTPMDHSDHGEEFKKWKSTCKEQRVSGGCSRGKSKQRSRIVYPSETNTSSPPVSVKKFML